MRFYRAESMSAGKTLSNGTLALKFMQNAQRAKQKAQVELEQAKVKDEAEWEVAKEVRLGWDEGSNSTRSRYVSTCLARLLNRRPLPL